MNRSIRLLAAGVFLATACTAPLSVENRSCPCISGSGYACCKLTNQCLPEGAACPTFQATVDHPQVRQGGTIKLTVIGVDLEGAADLALGELSLGTPPGARRDRFELTITIPHGTAPGAKTLRFTAHGGRDPYEAKAVVTVTPITVAVGGDDHAKGTTDSPFGTFARALDVAGAGDTVALGPGMFGQPPDPLSPIFLPAGITVTGDPHPATMLSGALTSNGDLTLRDLSLDWTVHIGGAGSRTTVQGLTAQGPNVGFEISPYALGATLVIGADTRIVSTLRNAVDWVADNGTLRIVDGATLANMDDNGKAIWITGDGLRLEIDGATISGRGANTVALVRHADVRIQGALFQGLLNLMGPSTTAVVTNTRFLISSQTNGVGGIYFLGTHLDVSDCVFSVVGLFQSSDAAGAVTVRRSTFDGYRESAVILQQGSLDLGTDADPGENHFQPGFFVTSPPVALEVVADTGTASASFSATSVAGVTPPAAMVMGPAQQAPIYQIAHMVPIQFF